MRFPSGLATAGLVAALLGGTSSLGAQGVVSGEEVRFELGGRLHSQLASSSVAGTRAADVFIRRARFKAELEFNQYMTGTVQVDFAGSSVSLKDALAHLTLAPLLEVDMGQFKRAFDPFELASSTELELVERVGGIDGLDVCAGVGGICSYSRFTQELGYSERDVGIRIHGDADDEAWGYMVTVTNGAGANTSDENDAKSAAGRLTVGVGPRIRVGANVSVHDWVGPDGTDEYATALGADVSYGDYRGGVHARAALVGGDNWMRLDGAGEPVRFLTGQALVSYYHPLEGRRLLEGIEPSGRVSWGDPDTDADDDGGLLLTPGFFAYLQGRNRIGANLDIYAPQAGDTEVSFKLMWFLYF